MHPLEQEIKVKHRVVFQICFLSACCNGHPQHPPPHKKSVVCTTKKVFLNKDETYCYDKNLVVFNTLFPPPVVEFLSLFLCLLESLDWSFLHVTHTDFPNNSIQLSAENDWEVTEKTMPFYADISRAAPGIEQTWLVIWMCLDCPVANVRTGTLRTETSLTWEKHLTVSSSGQQYFH